MECRCPGCAEGGAKIPRSNVSLRWPLNSGYMHSVALRTESRYDTPQTSREWSGCMSASGKNARLTLETSKQNTGRLGRRGQERSPICLINWLCFCGRGFHAIQRSLISSIRPERRVNTETTSPDIAKFAIASELDLSFEGDVMQCTWTRHPATSGDHH